MGRPATMMRARVYSLLIIVAVAALAESAAATVVHPMPKKELRRRRPARFKRHRLHRQQAYVPTYNKEQQEYVHAHNTLRASIGMPPLTWDPVLAAAANQWAVERRRDCSFRQHSRSPYGENIYFMNYREFTPSDVVLYWFNETRYYDGARKRCTCVPERDGCECGHFLSVVWKTTKRVGCSPTVYCDNQKGVVIVCEYDPPGCIKGFDPFTGRPL